MPYYLFDINLYYLVVQPGCAGRCDGPTITTVLHLRMWAGAVEKSELSNVLVVGSSVVAKHVGDSQKGW